jgi:ADP-ribose pyrophosphatase YjhB (NUDIX family)
MSTRDTFCSYCGARHAEPLAYPRTCPACAVTVWANPIPVAVVLQPIVVADRTGLLVVRRAIPPQIGKLALVGGFIEEHEAWADAAAREVREETGARIDPAGLAPFWYASSEPRPNRVLLFALAAPIALAALPPFTHDAESSERGVIFGPGELASVFAFSSHIEA